MSGERADNGALLDYTDLFGPGRAVQISIKNFELQVQPGSPDESRNTRWISVERGASRSKTFPLWKQITCEFQNNWGQFSIGSTCYLRV